MAERKVFDEAVWQLTRPLNKANVRVLALEPGGPPRLASTPRIDPATKRAAGRRRSIRRACPRRWARCAARPCWSPAASMAALLYVQPSSGPEKSLLLPDLFKAAEEADVNLVVLRAASTPRQPGGRNWLWQKVEVKGLEQAMQHARVADFLNALGGTERAPAGLGHALRPAHRCSTSGRRADLPGGPLQSPVGDLFSGIVSDITGRVITAGLQANMRSAERQQELDQRLIPGIPSDFQFGYLVLVVLGLFGVPISRAWWRRLWPPEAATEYAGRAGYLAARTVRGGGLSAHLPAADGAGERALQSGAPDLGGDHGAGALVALADADGALPPSRDSRQRGR